MTSGELKIQSSENIITALRLPAPLLILCTIEEMSPSNDGLIYFFKADSPLEDTTYSSSISSSFPFFDSVANKGLKEYPYEAAEILGNTIWSNLQWLGRFIQFHWGKLHPFLSYSLDSLDSSQNNKDTGIYSLSTGKMLSLNRLTDGSFDFITDLEPVRLALSADWGSGTREADYVQQLMFKDFMPDYTIHLGDIYYLGTPDEIRSNMLGIAPKGILRGVKWPHGKKGAFALNGNVSFFFYFNCN